HVLLAVASVDPQGVKLEELAPVILVEAASAGLLDLAFLVEPVPGLPRFSVVVGTFPVVQVKKHGRTPGDGLQKVRETPQGPGPDAVPQVGSRHPAAGPLLAVDV